jgi:hypothetical protein
MNQHGLVVTLIEKRCLHLVNSWDYTVLRDGTTAKAGGLDAAEWLRVGQANEYLNRYIKMAEYLSNDEMMLSSLVGRSGPTFFINTGDRKNCARKDLPSTFEERLIIIGLVGPLFQKQGQMDAALMWTPLDQALTKTSRRRQQDPRVTRLFLKFFGCDKLPDSSSRFNHEVYNPASASPLKPRC